MPSIVDNLKSIREDIANAAIAANRNPDSVRLLAVSKTFPAEDIQCAFDGGGQLMFGENRVQELACKCPALPREIEWHLIGHLQSNKAPKAVSLAQWIHSVDSEKLLRKISGAAVSLQKEINILLELNLSGEAAKTGIANPDLFDPLTELALTLPGVRLRGFMTMAALDADESTARKTFSELREIRDSLQQKFKAVLPELSMGMSADYRYAIAEGATIVRIGSAIFGHR